ncbi:hypothetical protein Pint_02067 [Pistacia integerrima]|uniref:Uncharacterized protein n=1 Tax=Pistacia integerrima TaxID=434235 RepID=A0ACC0ZRR4_9ROSI|nr:hypothetical protein Pint_02067 [Pistacia integerrima]
MEVEEVTFLITGGEVKPMITMPTSATVYQLKKKITEHTGVPSLLRLLKYGLRVNKIHKVIQLKQKVGQIWGIETKDVTLWHLSKKMEDDKALYKYYISEGSDVQFTRTGFYTYIVI